MTPMGVSIVSDMYLYQVQGIASLRELAQMIWPHSGRVGQRQVAQA